MNKIATRLKRMAEQTFRDEMLDAHDGQTDNILIAYDGDKEVGTLEYTVYDNKPSINMINVQDEHKRKGIGTKLIQELQRKFPNAEIEWGITTSDGSALKGATTYEVENEEYTKISKEIDELKDKMKELEDKFDAGTSTDEDGDIWNDASDRVDELEKEIYDMKPTITLVKV